MNKFFLILLVAGFAEWAHGHHSNDYHFDSEIGVTVEGTVTAFRFISPHARLILDVVDENGEIEAWDCELAAAVGLRRRGWTQDVFQPGDEIVIRGFSARRSDTECYFQTAEFNDGRRITMSDTFESESQAPVRSVAPIFSNPNIPNFSRVWRRARISGGGGGGPRCSPGLSGMRGDGGWGSVFQLVLEGVSGAGRDFLAGGGGGWAPPLGGSWPAAGVGSAMAMHPRISNIRFGKI